VKPSEAENILLLSTIFAIEVTKDKTEEEALFLSNLFQATGFQIAALAALKAAPETPIASDGQTKEDGTAKNADSKNNPPVNEEFLNPK
jgi:hypothetical protein